jgi:hypothetical protein
VFDGGHQFYLVTLIKWLGEKKRFSRALDGLWASKDPNKKGGKDG